ncbi:MAG: ligand-binding sensor domain-containing protein [Chitinophagales bacterium]
MKTKTMIPIYLSIYVLFSCLLCALACTEQEPFRLPKQEITEAVSIGKKVSVTTSTKPESPVQFGSGVLAMLEDSKGNIWFGTAENGVYRYDGRQFFQVTTTEGLCANQVNKIQEDEQGHIWFNTGGQYCRFDGQQFTAISPREAKIIGEVGKNNVWLGGDKTGKVYAHDGKTLAQLQFPMTVTNTINNNDNSNYNPYWVNHIYQDRVGNVWFCTIERGVIRYNGQTFKHFSSTEFDNSLIRTVFQDAAGKYWFGGNGGVFVYDGQTVRHVEVPLTESEHPMTAANEGQHDHIWTIEQDATGLLLFGTVGAGVWSYDGTTWTNYGIDEGLKSQFITTIYEDKLGLLWFTANDGRVYQFNGVSFQPFTSSC